MRLEEYEREIERLDGARRPRGLDPGLLRVVGAAGARAAELGTYVKVAPLTFTRS